MPNEKSPVPDGEVTILLHAIRAGERDAEAKLIALVQHELHQIAQRLMRAERRDHTLQPTALVNEAYLRLLTGTERNWENRSHFFIVAAQVMRRILVDHARARGSQKRGGTQTKVLLDDFPVFGYENWEEIIALDGALSRLAAWDEQQSRIVELRFFAGLSEEETAEVLNISSRTVRRNWKVARAWLRGELEGSSSPLLHDTT
jgi:RNA polymerase sigma-70 factor (ECF subfamily)